MLSQLFLIAASFGATEAFDSLILWVETAPQEVRLGDPVFVRISARNMGKEPIVIPARFPQDIGGLCRFELVDKGERTRFAFFPDGGGSGGVSKITLAPDDVAIVLYDVLALPRPDWFDHRFWMPKEWRSDSYELAARLRLGKRVYYETFGSKIRIDRRPENEIAALREFYNGGIHAPSPPGWAWDRPTLGLFGAIGFPLVGSLPDELAVIEQELSAGSLRDAVHGTRLTARLYDAKKVDERREAADELVKWLDARHEIARHWMAMQLVSWASDNRGLGEYRFEFVDRLIPRGPEEYGGRKWQDEYRQQNDSRRQSYLEYLQRPQAPPESPGVKRATGERRDPAPVSANAPATLTPSGARLLGNIRAAGGSFWLPGPAWRPWQPRPGVRSFGVRLPGKMAAREMVAALGELGTVEYLAIVGPEAPDDALAGLPMLRDLRNLSLRDTRISDAALQHLRELPKLQYLFLTRTDVDDRALAHVSNMKGLVTLGLDFTTISDRGLKHLQGLTELRVLNLTRTKITDEGLQHLEPLKQLERLNLLGTRVTPEGVARLREALPDL